MAKLQKINVYITLDNAAEIQQRLNCLTKAANIAQDAIDDLQAALNHFNSEVQHSTLTID